MLRLVEDPSQSHTCVFASFGGFSFSSSKETVLRLTPRISQLVIRDMFVSLFPFVVCRNACNLLVQGRTQKTVASFMRTRIVVYCSRTMHAGILSYNAWLRKRALASSPPHPFTSLCTFFCGAPFFFAEVVAGEEREESDLEPPPCCAGVECRERANEGCRKKLACGHPCRGPGKTQLHFT